MPYELYAGFKLLYKSSLAKKSKTNVRYFCVLCNVLLCTFVIFTNLFRKSLDILLRSSNLNLQI